MKLKNILLATVFLLCIIGANAQEKYEYGVVRYGMGSSGLEKSCKTIISLGQLPVTIVEGKLDNLYFEDFSNVNKVLGELSEQGWDLYRTEWGLLHTGLSVNMWYFYLRKKK